MRERFEKMRQDALRAVAGIVDREILEKLRVEFLGRKGKRAELMKEMATLASQERKLVGAVAHEVKAAMEAVFVDAEKRAVAAEQSEAAEQERVDVTQPLVSPRRRGHLHPVTQVREDLEDLFTSMGFVVTDGPELESDYFNFTALNIPPTHPARDMQDTFYLDAHPHTVMRTHTSPVQIRGMRRFGFPLRLIVPGRCFRNEATDVRHEHTFHQLEGVVVDHGITFGHMKGVLESVAKHLYGQETRIRLRPKFYPFVEPGVNGEVACYVCRGEGCRLCKKSGWLEIFGAGMIHPNVLREGGADPEVYSGFAFGCGLTRLVMLKYGIDDSRHLEGGDLRFLNQF
jgi:phenylalanyl-tRNA synthetase alpha chain